MSSQAGLRRGAAPDGSGSLRSQAARSTSRRVGDRLKIAWATSDLRAYLSAIALTVAAVFVMARLWLADLMVPFYYLENDAAAVFSHFKTVMETGWYEAQPALGAPAGQAYHDFPTADNLHMMAARILGWFTNDVAVAANLYYLIGFPLAAVTALWFLRQCGLSRPMAVVMAVLFAVAPYHFLRHQGHLFLGSYYPIPLGSAVVLRVIRGQQLWSLRSGSTRWRKIWAVLSGRGAITVYCLATVATASTYYLVFTLVLLAAAGFVALARTGSLSRFRGAVVAGLVGLVVAGLNMAPDNLYQWLNGPNLAGFSRDGVASEIYALKFSSLVLPAPGHPLSFFADFRARYDSNYPLPSENPALGLVAAAGFLILLVMMVEFIANRTRASVPTPEQQIRRDTLRHLSTLTWVAFFAATVGGFSTVISFFTPNIRGWNRMSIVIALLALAAVGLVIDAGIKRWVSRSAGASASRSPGRATVLIAAVVLVIGVADQDIAKAIPQYAQVAVSWHSDDDFVQQIQTQLPAGSMVFQLPYVEFPETDSVNQVSDTDQLRLYLHSTTLRWSAGSIRGRPAADWPSFVTDAPVAQMLTDLATIGFAGLTVDRKRAGENTPALERQLAAMAGPMAAVSTDGRYSFFNLLAYRTQLRSETPTAELTARASMLTSPIVAYPSPKLRQVDPVLVPAQNVASAVTGTVIAAPRYTDQGGGVFQVVNDRSEPATVQLQLELSSSTGAADATLTVAGVDQVVRLPADPANKPTADPREFFPAAPVLVNLTVTIAPGTSDFTIAPGPATADPGAARYTVWKVEFVG